MGGDASPREETAIGAARRAATAAGLPLAGTSELLGVTNNVVLALDSDVVAKVGTWAHSRNVLARELRVAALLTAAGAAVAPPVPGAEVFVDAATGYAVTLWQRVGGLAHDDTTDPDVLARGLRELHAALDLVDAQIVDAPDFLWGLDLAAATLATDTAMAFMQDADLLFLRSIYDQLLARTREHLSGVSGRLLHGEPHGGNVLVTNERPTFLDFEGVCLGPLEWDLASVDPAVAARYPGPIDADLLALLNLLNRARVAVWCWAGADRGDMRWHAEHHLAYLKDVSG